MHLGACQNEGPQVTWASYAGIITTEMPGICIHMKGAEEKWTKTEGFSKIHPSPEATSGGS